MNIFDYVKNESFFSPLASKNRRIYFECINVLIERSKSVGILYDDEIRDCINSYLQRSNTELEAEDGDDIESTSVNRIINRFKECGWLTKSELGRRGQWCSAITPDCWKVMGFLNKLMSHSDYMSNHLFSMHEILLSCLDKNSQRAVRPFTNGIKPLLEHQVELENELMELKSNIASIMKSFTDMEIANDIGRFMMKDEMLERFFKEYFYIKNNGNVQIYISEIRGFLRRFVVSDLIERAAQEYADINKRQLGLEDARDAISNYVNQIQYFVTCEYDDLMYDIDSQITKYYNLATLRIKYALSDGLELESRLDQFLTRYKNSSEQEKDELLSGIDGTFELIRQQYLSTNSLGSFRKRSSKPVPVVEDDVVVTEAMRQATINMLQRQSNQYSVAKINKYFEGRLEAMGTNTITSNTVSSREDAMMFIAAFVNRGSDLKYEVTKHDDVLDLGFVDISNITVRSKANE